MVSNFSFHDASSLLEEGVIVDGEEPDTVVLNYLSRGYAITVGNAMRRVMLSSLPGWAVTCLRISGVEHEFTSVSGMREDVMDFILNLKQVKFKSDDRSGGKIGDRQEVVLKVSASEGDTVVTSSMIDVDGTGLSVVGDEVFLFSLSKGHSVDISLFVTYGVGHVFADDDGFESNQSKLDKIVDVSLINVDGVYFSPVKSVSYDHFDVRKGQVANYEKLVMSIETDGSLTPSEACKMAAMIMINQLKPFVGSDLLSASVVSDAAEEEDDDGISKLLCMPVSNLELSMRAQNCLCNENIVYIYDLVSRTESEMLKCPNFGRKSLNEVKVVLAACGLHFGMDVGDFSDLSAVSNAANKKDS